MERKLSNVAGLAVQGRGEVDESSLWLEKESDPAAREQLVLLYEPFARGMALRYRYGSEAPDDLIQVAMVGLLNAIDRFDPRSGSTFKSFAGSTISGELKRFFRDRVWLVRVPRNVQEDILAVDEAVSDLGAELHRAPTNAEIEEHADLEEGDAAKASMGRKNRQVRSMDSGNDPDGLDRNETIGKDDRGYADFDLADGLNTAMDDLDDTAKLVLRLRFAEELTQSEIAERINCSQMHVSRLIKRSLASIERAMGTEK